LFFPQALLAVFSLFVGSWIMSLSSLLNQKDVRAKFRQEFPKPKMSNNRELLAPPLTTNYFLIGTAFDYLMRFQLKARNPQAIEQYWVAEDSVRLLKEKRLIRLYEQGYLIITEARENYASFLKTQQITDELIKSALLLSKLDSFYRAERIDENLLGLNKKDVEDLRNLLAITDFSFFKSSELLLLNPSFGLASIQVGGADADLIIDDLLVDIKTTKNFKFEQDDFNQLMGYYTLSKIDAIDGAPPGHEIKRLGIYYSRYAYLFVFNVADVVSLLTFSKFLEWFQERADINDY
jgi:hypothetical protein